MEGIWMGLRKMLYAGSGIFFSKAWCARRVSVGCSCLVLFLCGLAISFSSSVLLFGFHLINTRSIEV